MNLIEELRALQDSAGCLRDAALEALARRIGVPLYEVQGVASFYPQFRREPAAEFEVAVCRDLSCALRGAEDARAQLERACAGRSDARVVGVSCLGRCDAAPACAIADVPVSVQEAERVVREGGAPRPGVPGSATPMAARGAGSWESDPYRGSHEHYAVLGEWLAANGDGASAIAALERSELEGRGGAGFPAARKWQTVRDAPGERRFAICNADESEPGTFKDRVILAELPHLVVEGLVLAGLAVGAERGIVYIRHEYEPERRALAAELERARERGVLGADVLESGRAFDVDLFVSAGGYVLGEESALLEALEGRRGEPRIRPPFPGVRGLFGCPTLIHNVETLALLPRVLRIGSAELKWFSVSGDVERPAVLEAPLGTPFRELLERCGGMRGAQGLQAFLPGGASTALLGAEHIDVAMETEALAAAGSALGSGAVIAIGSDADLLEVARGLATFFRNESCGKCVPCRLGTERAVDLLARGREPDLEQLSALRETLADTSICGLGQSALVAACSALALRGA